MGIANTSRCNSRIKRASSSGNGSIPVKVVLIAAIASVEGEEEPPRVILGHFHLKFESYYYSKLNTCHICDENKFNYSTQMNHCEIDTVHYHSCFTRGIFPKVIELQVKVNPLPNKYITI